MEWIGKYQNLWKKIGIAAAVCLGMKYLAPLVIPFLIAGAIVYWCRPLLEALKTALPESSDLSDADSWEPGLTSPLYIDTVFRPK